VEQNLLAGIGDGQREFPFAIRNRYRPLQRLSSGGEADGSRWQSPELHRNVARFDVRIVHYKFEGLDVTTDRPVGYR
jgi:hypothetical protein